MEEINTKDLGPHWTYDKDEAYCYDAGKRGNPDGEEFFLEIKIPKNKVLWHETIARQLSHAESEVNPKAGHYQVKVYDENWEYLSDLKGKVIPAQNKYKSWDVH